MRKYYDDFNEDYERGYKDGRREALRRLDESKDVDLDKLERFLKSNKGIFSYKKDIDEDYNYTVYILRGEIVSLSFIYTSSGLRIEISAPAIGHSGNPRYSFDSNLNSFQSDLEHYYNYYATWLKEVDALRKLIKVIKSSEFNCFK